MADQDVDAELKVTGNFTELEKKSKKATKDIISDFEKQTQAAKKAEAAINKAGVPGTRKGTGNQTTAPTPIRKTLAIEEFEQRVMARREVFSRARSITNAEKQTESSLRAMERRREREETRISREQERIGKIQERAMRENVIFDKTKEKRESAMYDDALKEDYIRGQRQQASTQKQIDRDHSEALRMNQRIEDDAQAQRERREKAHLKGLIENKRRDEEAVQKMQSSHEAALRMNETRDKKGIMKLESAHQEALRMNASRDKKREQGLDLAHQQGLIENQRRDRHSARREEVEFNKQVRMAGSISNRALRAPAAVQAQINAILNAPGAMSSRIAMVGGGLTRQQAFAQQLQQGGFNRQAATFLVGGGGTRPPQLGGRGGLFSGFSAGGLLRGATQALGLGTGIFAGIQLGRAALEAEKTATAYERQRVAAANLAGDQEKLNQLLESYGEASGGAVSKVTELANVTRLLATGFAKTPEDLERFVRATRGASIALGKPQDYVIQETQLAISNTSQKRLDQIGLGIKEVVDEVERLRSVNADWTREMAFQEAVVSLLDKKYGELTKTAIGQATEIEKLAKNWEDLGLSMGKASTGTLNALAKLLNFLIVEPEAAKKVRLEQSRKAAIGNDQANSFVGASGLSLYDLVGMLTGRTGTQVRAQHVLNNGLFPQNSGTGYIGGPDAPGAAAVPGTRFREDQQSAVDSAYDRIQDIEKSANEARLNEIKNFERQREDVIIAYGKSLVREEQDFARQRARSLRDYERSIVDIMRDAQDREAEMSEDLADTIAEASEDSEKKIAKAEEKYQKDREKAAKDHRDRLLKAAGQLDAIAVLEERKRWKRENEEREEGHKESLADEREALAERIADARDAFDEQIEDARKADAKRLEDMRSNRELQISDENEDRELRKQRAEEDHNAQLDEMTRVHEERMIQIQEQADKETKIIEDALALDLQNMGYYIKGVSELIKKREDAITDWIDGLIDSIEARANLNPDLFTKPSDGTTPVFRGSSRTANKSVVFNEGAIQINPLAGTDVYDLTELVRDTIVQVLEME